MRFLRDLTLSDEIILVSFNFSGTESDFLLNFCLLLLDISLLISHLIDHTFFFEIFLSCFSLDSSLLSLLFFEFALQVLEERHRADSYVFDVDTLKPHTPSLEQGLEFGSDLAG